MAEVRAMSYLDIDALLQVLLEEQREQERQAQLDKAKSRR